MLRIISILCSGVILFASGAHSQGIASNRQAKKARIYEIIQNTQSQVVKAYKQGGFLFPAERKKTGVIRTVTIGFISTSRDTGDLATTEYNVAPEIKALKWKAELDAYKQNDFSSSRILIDFMKWADDNVAMEKEHAGNIADSLENLERQSCSILELPESFEFLDGSKSGGGSGFSDKLSPAEKIVIAAAWIEKKHEAHAKALKAYEVCKEKLEAIAKAEVESGE